MPNSLVTGHEKQQQTVFIAEQRYGLFEVIAQTALVTFYHAQDVKTLEADESASRVVVGLVNPALDQISGFNSALSRVLAEFNTASATPFISDYGYENGQIWFVMPQLRGTPLNTYINQVGRFGYPVGDTLDTAEQIIQAVRQSPLKREYGYLEPGAVYYDKDTGHCTLLNAPIAITLNIISQSKQGGELTKPTLHSGYLSPEVAMGHTPVETDDTFSLAVIIYQMLNGHLPFVHDHTVEAALKNSTPAAIAKLEPESSQVVLQALAFKRAERPVSAEELLHLIHNPPALPRSGITKPWLKLTAGLAATLLLGGATYLYMNPESGLTLPDSWGFNNNIELSAAAIKQLPEDHASRVEFEKQQQETRKITAIQQQYQQESLKLSEVLKQQEAEARKLAELKQQQEAEVARLQKLRQQLETQTTSLTQEAGQNNTPAKNQATKQERERLETQKEATEQALKRQKEKEQQAARKLAEQKAKEEAAARRLAEQQQKEREAAEELARQKEQEAAAARELARQLAEQKRREKEEAERRAALQKQREEAERRAAAQKQREEAERRAALQKQREEDERRAALQKQREEAERRAAAQKRREEAERRAAAQKQREEDERRAALQKQREEAERRAAAQKRREEAERRAAAQKRREETERRAALQKQREEAERRAAAQKQREAAERRAALSPAPQLIISTGQPMFENPRLFGQLTPTEQAAADQACRQTGAIKALGFHPEAIGLNGATQPMYLCARTPAELQRAALVSSQPATGQSPRLVRPRVYTWKHQNSFQPVPAHLQAEGRRVCQSQGKQYAVGYHPRAVDSQGRPISGGGFLCR